MSVAGLIWFFFTVKLLIGPWKVYNYLFWFPDDVTLGYIISQFKKVTGCVSVCSLIDKVLLLE